MTAIQSKWDGKAKKPVSNMQALAEYVAWMKELPSRAMYVDFHVDKNFNTTNTANAFTRTLPGPSCSLADRSQDTTISALTTNQTKLTVSASLLFVPTSAYFAKTHI